MRDELMSIADSLAVAAEDYREIIPQFHAHARKVMRAEVTTIDDAIAKLRALATQQPEAGEYVMVPREPTDEMIWAGRDAWQAAHDGMKKYKQHRSPMTETWAALLSAAPLYAAPKAEAREVWLPIESAPRNSSHILLFGDGDAIRQCAYVGSWREERHGHEGWMLIGGADARPTHWMPLPTPPALSAQRAEADVPDDIRLAFALLGAPVPPRGGP